jgi:unsaturated rhamnogalacturonyl hydrolase
MQTRAWRRRAALSGFLRRNGSRQCALALALTLSGCGGGGEPSNTASGASEASVGSGSTSSGSGAATSGTVSGTGTATGESAGSSSSTGTPIGTGSALGNAGASGTTNGSTGVSTDDAGSGMSDAASPGDASADDSGPLNPSVLAMMRKVADWQLAQPGVNAIDWIHGAMWTGILATYQATGDAKYLNAAKAWGQANNWSLAGGITTNADNQCAAQTYFDTYLLAPGPSNMKLVTGAKPSFDAMVASGNAGWTWEDALFMSAPGLTRLGVIQNDPKYFQLLDANWSRTYASLFNVADGLSCRDPNCNGVYWARGDGWVIAALARVLEYLPATESRRTAYEAQLKTMATVLERWQGTDGLWRSDITHPARFPNQETSGTGLITFAIAWGINSGLLDRATHLPVVQKGWQGLVSAVDASGRLGYVQPVGVAPAPAGPGNTAEYGIGAFLLAGSQFARIGP